VSVSRETVAAAVVAVVAGAIGLAILTTVSTTRTNNLLADGVATPAALTDGFKLAFTVGVGSAVIALVATLILLGCAPLPKEESGEPRLERADEDQIAA
jgi:hypothetical protein